MEQTVIQTVKETIEKHQLIQDGDGIVIGVSGGADSMCLLSVLIKLAKPMSLRLYAVHIHHGLRQDTADADAAYVVSFCDENEIDLTVYREHVGQYAKDNNLSLEEAGRVIRYERFETVRQLKCANHIAVAHHQNDLVETYLFNMMRGSGVDGLASISYKRHPHIIRPLLDLTREAVENYCHETNLMYQIDETNLSNDYMRNKIRNLLIPYIKDNFNPSVEKVIARSAALFKEEQEFWKQHTKRLFDTHVKQERGTLSIKKIAFDAMSKAEQRHLIREMIFEVRGNLKNISNECVERILYLDNTGTKVEIDETYTWHLIHDAHVLKGILEPSLKPDISIEIMTLEVYQQRKAKNNEIAVDASKIVGRLYLRHREPGDFFSPIGMTGSKKLKKYFIDEKIPNYLRDEIWLLCDEEKIIWILDGRMSETCKVTKNTKNVMLIGIEGSL